VRPNPPSKLNECAEAIASFNDRRRRQFYEALAHNLTVCVRGIWSDDSISDAEKVEQMKCINEIQHRTTGQLRAQPRPDAEFFEGVLRAHTDQCPPLRGQVGWAVKQSYEYAATDRPEV
jgi:hypothetical protein